VISAGCRRLHLRSQVMVPHSPAPCRAFSWPLGTLSLGTLSLGSPRSLVPAFSAGAPGRSCSKQPGEHPRCVVGDDLFYMAQPSREGEPVLLPCPESSCAMSQGGGAASHPGGALAAPLACVPRPPRLLQRDRLPGRVVKSSLGFSCPCQKQIWSAVSCWHAAKPASISRNRLGVPVSIGSGGYSPGLGFCF